MDPLKASQSITRSSSSLPEEVQTRGKEGLHSARPLLPHGNPLRIQTLSPARQPAAGAQPPSRRAGAGRRALQPHGDRPCPLSLRVPQAWPRARGGTHRRERGAALLPTPPAPAAAAPPPGRGRGKLRHGRVTGEAASAAALRWPPAPAAYRRDGGWRSRPPRPKRPPQQGPAPLSQSPRICLPPLSRSTRPQRRAAPLPPLPHPEQSPAAGSAPPHGSSRSPLHPRTTNPPPLRHLELGLAESASGPWNMVADDGLDSTASRATLLLGCLDRR